MTLICEFDLNMVKVYLHGKNEVSRSKRSKINAFTDRQTDRQTERQKDRHIRLNALPQPHLRVMLITMTQVNPELENVASAAALPLEVARRSSRYRMLVPNIVIWCGTLCWFCRLGPENSWLGRNVFLLYSLRLPGYNENRYP